jgi:hypothetical protein
MHFTGPAPDLATRVDEAIAQALVVAFRVIVLQELANGLTQRLLDEGTHAAKRFFLGAAHQSLPMAMPNGATRWQPDRLARMAISSCQGWSTKFMANPMGLWRQT